MTPIESLARPEQTPAEAFSQKIDKNWASYFAELAFPRKPRARFDDELKSLYPNPGKYP